MSANNDEMLHIPTVLKKALITFSSKPEAFKLNLEELVKLFNKTRANHVNLHPMFMNESTWTPKKKAPMTYIHIFNDDIINVGIFILKPRTKLPLHNHPDMYGLLKVISGTVKISSFSLNTEKTQKYLVKHEEETGKLHFAAEQMDEFTVNSDSECCILEPYKGNIHEIESLNGPAAFIDILSPPYDDSSGNNERKCRYFRLEKQFEPKIFELKEIDSPSWFWSDTFPYNGPRFTY